MNYLSSFIPSWANPETLSKRLVTFVLKQTIGKYLQVENHERINLELTSGTVHLTNVKINADALNELLNYKIPLLVNSGEIESLKVQIPWMDLLSGSCLLQIEGIRLNVALKHPSSLPSETATENDSDMHSSTSSLYLSTSIHIAQEFIKKAKQDHQDPDIVAALSNDDDLSAIEPLAKTIEGMAHRFKVELKNAIISINCIDSTLESIDPPSSYSGIELRINSLSIKDDDQSFDYNDSKPSLVILNKIVVVPSIDIYLVKEFENTYPNPRESWIMSAKDSLMKLSIKNFDDQFIQNATKISLDLVITKIKIILSPYTIEFMNQLNKSSSKYLRKAARHNELYHFSESTDNLQDARSFIFDIDLNIYHINLCALVLENSPVKNDDIAYITEEFFDRISVDYIEIKCVGFSAFHSTLSAHGSTNTTAFELQDFKMTYISKDNLSTSLIQSLPQEFEKSPFLSGKVNSIGLLVQLQHDIKISPNIDIIKKVDSCYELSKKSTLLKEDSTKPQQFEIKIRVSHIQIINEFISPDLECFKIDFRNIEATTHPESRDLSVYMSLCHFFLPYGNQQWKPIFSIDDESGVSCEFRFSRTDAATTDTKIQNQDGYQFFEKEKSPEPEWHDLIDDKKPEATSNNLEFKSHSISVQCHKIHITQVKTYIDIEIIDIFKGIWNRIHEKSTKSQKSIDVQKLEFEIYLLLESSAIIIDTKSEKFKLEFQNVEVSKTNPINILMTCMNVNFALNENVIAYIKNRNEKQRAINFVFQRILMSDINSLENIIHLDIFGLSFPTSINLELEKIRKWSMNALQNIELDTQPESESDLNISTMLKVILYDSSINFKSKSVSGEVYIGKLSGILNLIQDAPELSTKISIKNIKVNIGRNLGFDYKLENDSKNKACIAHCSFLEILFRYKKGHDYQFFALMSGHEIIADFYSDTFLLCKLYGNETYTSAPPTPEIFDGNPVTSELDALQDALKDNIYKANHTENFINQTNTSDINFKEDFFDILKDLEEHNEKESKMFEKKAHDHIKTFPEISWNIISDYLSKKSDLSLSSILQGRLVNLSNLNVTFRLFSGFKLPIINDFEDADILDADDIIFPDDNEKEQCSVEIKITHMSISFEIFQKHEMDLLNRLRLQIKEIEILDHVESSVWNKLMTSVVPDKDERPRETNRDMIKLEISNFNIMQQGPEVRIKLYIYPIQLQIDQDSLDFLIQFFQSKSQDNDLSSKEDVYPDETFFRKCFIKPINVEEMVEISPIRFRIDYKPKNLDIRNLAHGQYLELLHFFALDDVELTLNHVKLAGLKGFKKLASSIGSQWLPHVYNTQLPNVATGISGVRSLINIGSGMADLILLPLDEYKRDGKWVRGIQKGAKSFAKNAAIETLKLGSRLAEGTQILLEKAEDLFSSSNGLQMTNYQEIGGTIIAIPVASFQGDSRTLRAIPVAILKPIIGKVEKLGKIMNVAKKEMQER